MKSWRCKGQSLVESSLILAAFMVLLLGMVFAGQSVFLRQTLAERVHDAVRWGAMNPYNPQAIRNLVLYGKAAPECGAKPFLGLNAAEVAVTNPGCPGPQCRVRVAISNQGIRATEPVEYGNPSTGDAVSKP